MNPEIKAEWVKALRSGEYKQGRSYLRTDEGFCCLGVLCDLYVKNRPEAARWVVDTDESDKLIVCQFRSAGHYKGAVLSFPPHHVQELASLDDDSMRKLAGMNDNGKTFEEIADCIEKNL